MSRIGQLNELRALRADVDRLTKLTDEMASQILRHAQMHHTLLDRILALEQKRGPGRPRNDERKPTGSD